jgi:poly(hydroxyalkanoate) granule-associated protein
MAKRRKSSDDSAAGRASQAGRDSAQKIWLAGLGAFERAKSEGPKMFEALVEQGRSLGVKAREGADQAMRAMREGASDAGGKWDKLEQVFEQRVAKSLNRLGVITSKEVDDLSRQVRELNDNVRDMMRGGARSAKAAAPKRKASKAKRATRKGAATRKKAAKR